MNEDRKITIDYSDVRRALERDAGERRQTQNEISHFSQPSVLDGAFVHGTGFGSSEVQSGCEESFSYRSSPVAAAIAIGGVVTITLLVALIGMAIIIKTARENANMNFGGITQNGAPSASNSFQGDGSSQIAQREASEAIDYFCHDVFAIELPFGEDFSCKGLQWTDKSNVLSLIIRYRHASSAVSEWLKRLGQIDLDSDDYRNVPNELKERFEEYRDATFKLNDVFSSFAFDWQKIDSSLDGAGIYSYDVFFRPLSLVDDGNEDGDTSSLTFPIELGLLREEYNNQIRNIESRYSSCVSARKAFKKSCFLY